MEKTFDRIHIEITNICNVQCSFCPEVVRPKNNMNIHQFEECVKQVAPLTKQICLHLMGEPLVHKDLEAFFQIAEKYDIPVNLTTNGLLLKQKEEILFQAKSLRQINISIQSFHDNFPEKSLEDYLQYICQFIIQLSLRRPEVYLNLRLWNQGADAEIENEAVFKFLEDFFKITINRKVEVALTKSKKLFDKVYLHFDSRFDWPSFDLPYQGDKGTCQGLRNHFGILSDGTVVPCCLDKEANINLGNLFETPLNTILASERAVKMKEGFERGELCEKLCQHCPYIRRFDKKLKGLTK